MNEYEFLFKDGTRLIGSGNDPAEGLLDAYHRNGFLPISKIIETTILNAPQPVTAPKKKVRN
jgi:hypothetical protein